MLFRSKHVPLCEYNPFEAVKTNVLGTQNVIEAAIKNCVKKVINISTDKATNPINLYGASKLAAEKLFLAANALVGRKNLTFSVVRYGNVLGSRGSIIPYFKELSKKKVSHFPITDRDMTRFFIELDDSVKFVLRCFDKMKFGEVFIPKLYSFKITDLAKILSPKTKHRFIGIRPGEKLHEFLCALEENRNILEFKTHYVIFKNIEDKKKFKKKFKSKSKEVSKDFYYSSENNSQFLNFKQIKKKFSKF